MEADGDIHWPGKAGVHTSGLLVTVSPTLVRMPWVEIGREKVIRWDPRELGRGLYFVRATMTDRLGNQGSSQIVARVGQPFLPVMLTDISMGRDGKISLQWRETEFNIRYAYTVEYCDDLVEGVWQEAELDGWWPIPDTFWSGDEAAKHPHRFYRVMKDYEPK
jgi:hypothetical protein